MEIAEAISNVVPNNVDFFYIDRGVTLGVHSPWSWNCEVVAEGVWNWCTSWLFEKNGVPNPGCSLVDPGFRERLMQTVLYSCIYEKGDLNWNLQIIV